MALSNGRHVFKRLPQRQRPQRSQTRQHGKDSRPSSAMPRGAKPRPRQQAEPLPEHDWPSEQRPISLECPGQCHGSVLDTLASLHKSVDRPWPPPPSLLLGSQSRTSMANPRRGIACVSADGAVGLQCRSKTKLNLSLTRNASGVLVLRCDLGHARLLRC
eukprot:Amastigsp_a1709_28.p3 type:complete len:160 gc:universal Amastigsp_a1709_28:165-644(+)